MNCEYSGLPSVISYEKNKNMETKKTAIQSLVEDIKIGTLSDHIDGVEYFSKDTILEFLEKAKQVEKEQIAKAWDDGDYAYFCSKETGEDFENGEEYYNETYGK